VEICPEDEGEHPGDQEWRPLGCPSAADLESGDDRSCPQATEGGGPLQAPQQAGAR